MTELDQWLERVGLGKYAQAFVQNSIDLDVLADLTEDDLKQLGLTLGDRRRLQRAIREFARDDKYEVGAEAERRQLTVMFCDLVGSTALSEKLDAEDLREIIALFRQCVARSVAKFQGFIAKYMGDGVLVYFGYPQAYENDAEKALQAALELTGAVGLLETRETKLQVRIGIATGMVVVGDLIGTGEAQEHGVVGKTPDLAARLQSIAAADTIVIADLLPMVAMGLAPALQWSPSMRHALFSSTVFPSNAIRSGRLCDRSHNGSRASRLTGRHGHPRNMYNHLRLALNNMTTGIKERSSPSSL